MIKIKYLVRKTEPLALIVEKETERPTLAAAMEFVRSYSSVKESLIGKMMIEEAV